MHLAWCHYIPRTNHMLLARSMKDKHSHLMAQSGQHFGRTTGLSGATGVSNCRLDVSPKVARPLILVLCSGAI